MTHYACFGNAYDRWEVCALHRTTRPFAGVHITCDVLKVFTVENEQKADRESRRKKHPEKYVNGREPKELSRTAAYEACRQKAIEATDKLKAGK